MKKTIPFVLGCLLSLTALNANAGKNCDSYFNEMNELIKVAEKQDKGIPDAKEQIQAMKSQLEEAKKALATYPEAEQESACAQAVDAIKEAKAAGEL